MAGHRLSAHLCQPATRPVAFRRRLRWTAPLLLTAACGGCAAFSSDGGLTLVNGIVAPEFKSEVVKVRGEDLGQAHARAARLLSTTLSADGAVRIALLNNKGLQASYNELGIAEAATVEASLPPNPTFSISRLQTPVELDIERRIIMDILALATLRRAPSSPPNVSVRSSCMPPWKPCGSVLRHAKPTTARSRLRNLWHRSRKRCPLLNLPPSSPRNWARPAP